MDVKTTFLNGDFFKDVYIVHRLASRKLGMVIWFVSLRSRFMVLSRH